jgi:Tol biopolymer transport system component
MSRALCVVALALFLASCDAAAPRDIIFASRPSAGSDSLELFAMPRGGGQTLLMSESGPAASLPSRVVQVDVASGRQELLVESDTLGFVCPAVAPDGAAALISVALYNEARSEVVGMDIFSFSLADGSVRPFVPIAFAKDPRWSPDGGQIVFHGEDHLGWAAPTDSLDLYTLDRNGQNLVRLTRNEIADIHPAW